VADPEFSAGGVVVRGDEVVVIVPVKRGAHGNRVLGLPKGHPDGDETPEQAAKREVAEETGVTAELIAALGETNYTYERKGRRVAKRVAFFLFEYRSGDLADHDHEIEDARWMPLNEAGRSLTYAGEREMINRALSRLAGRACPELLLLGVCRPIAARSQDRHDPPGRQVPQVPQERLRARHHRLSALAAREDLQRGDRPG
jgi:8-oxo-dGTP pyrophosphatase MutT (NUDIX family)